MESSDHWMSFACFYPWFYHPFGQIHWCARGSSVGATCREELELNVFGVCEHLSIRIGKVKV